MNRLSLIIIAVLLSFSGLFGYLSYSYSEKIGSLEAKLTVCSNNTKALVLDVEKATKACSIADEINRKHNEEQKALDEKKEGIVKQIDSIPKKSHTTTKESSDVEETNVVDIDGVLPLDLQRMLNEAHRSAIQR